MTSHHLLIAILAVIFVTAPAFGEPAAQPKIDLGPSTEKLDRELTARYGEEARPRLERGMKQVADFWHPEDGDAAAFEEFVRANFAPDQKTLDAVFTRIQYALQETTGHMLEISRVYREQTDLDRGPVLPFDDILAGYDPSAHLNDDSFGNKLAFVVLLNFPLTTLDERLAQGERWTRRQWAEARLAQRFSHRIPAEVNLRVAKAGASGEKYIAEYNIWMHHLLTDDGERIFPPKLRLLSHWNLRDEIKADYSDPNGLAKQRMIQKVMERIVTQTIPASVIDNPSVDWKPFANTVAPAAENDSDRTPAPSPVSAAPEPDTRYVRLLDNFRAQREVDRYSPTARTLMDRKFNEEREIPEARVRAMFEQVLTSPLVPQVAKLIRKRLGRPLEPFDLWYNGFRARGAYTEAQLDEIVRRRYPTPEAYKADIPRILQALGFSKEKAEYVASNIIVDPARGSGHAWGAGRPEDKAHLRTRVGPGGMDYKGYNIAVHEMGHNVEQTFSMNQMDYWLLSGVPNNAFTEALAMVLQGHDLELLGLASPDARSRSLATLNQFWETYEISGVGLVDMDLWRWMYAHPEATPAELRDATVQIAKDVWNRYYAPVFGRRDVPLLAIYSHMIELQMYLPDYAIGHLIAFQVEEQMNRAGKIGPEFERAVMSGGIAPDLWMKNATGAPVGPDALLAATKRALEQVQ